MEKFFGEVKKVACLQVSDIESSFVNEGYHVAGLSEILASLSSKGEVLLLENIESDIERKLVNLKPEEGQDKGANFIESVKNFFWNRQPPAKSDPLRLNPRHYVVHLPTLERIMEKYWQNDYDILRSDCYGGGALFKRKAELAEWLRNRGESAFDCQLVIYSLLERKVIYVDKKKDEFGHLHRGYVLHKPNSEEYKIHSTIQKLKDNIQYIERKTQELEACCRKLDEQIKANLQIKNKDAAKSYARNKLKIERDLVYLINQRSVIRDSLDKLLESVESGLDSEAWKLANTIIEQKIVELDDLKEGLQSLAQLKEKNQEVYELMADDVEKEEKDIQEELNKIEREMVLETAPEKNGQARGHMDAELQTDRPVNLLNNPFPTTSKKPQENLNPFLPRAEPEKFESFFGGLQPTKPRTSFFAQDRPSRELLSKRPLEDTENPDAQAPGRLLN